jgi:hypothetical protein
MMATSSRQCSSAPASRMRPRRGSSGSLDEAAAGVGELALVRQRAELAQRALAVAHVAAVGRLDERKGLDVARASARASAG